VSRELIYASQLEYSALMSDSCRCHRDYPRRFASYDDFKIALEDWEITDSFTAKIGESKTEYVTNTCTIPKLLSRYTAKLETRSASNTTPFSWPKSCKSRKSSWPVHLKIGNAVSIQHNTIFMAKVVQKP